MAPKIIEIITIIFCSWDYNGRHCEKAKALKSAVELGKDHTPTSESRFELYCKMSKQELTKTVNRLIQFCMKQSADGFSRFKRDDILTMQSILLVFPHKDYTSAANTICHSNRFSIKIAASSASKGVEAASGFSVTKLYVQVIETNSFKG